MNVTSALQGKLAPQRAAILLSLVAGIQIMRQMISLPALGAEADDDLAQILEPLIAKLMDG
jgi:hypothetical protein